MPGAVSPTNAKVTFRVDKDIKELTERLFKSLWMDMNTAANIFLRKDVEKSGIPFQVSKNKRDSYDMLKCWPAIRQEYVDTEKANDT